MREILVCMTFREFDGSINDTIQRKALDSLKAQTYQNFKLIVTNFKEKNTKNILDEYGFEYEFHQSDLEGFHMSWSELIINSFGHLTENNNIILWTNADNIFENNFIEEVVNNFIPLCSGTSWPMLYFNSIEDMEKGVTLKNHEMFPKKKNPYRGMFHMLINWIFPKDSIYSFDPNFWIPDVIFFDGDLFLNNKNKNDFVDHKMDGAYQGMAQSLMLAFFSNNPINLVYKSKINVIRNIRIDGEISWVDNPILKKESIINTEIIRKFCEIRNIPKKLRIEWPFSKINQNKKYRLIGSVSDKIKFNIYLILWRIFNYWKIFSLTGSPFRFLNIKKYFNKILLTERKKI